MKARKNPVWSIVMTEKDIHLYPQLSDRCFTSQVIEEYDEREKNDSHSLSELLRLSEQKSENSKLGNLLYPAQKDWFRDNPLIDKARFLEPSTQVTNQPVFLREKIFNKEGKTTSILTPDNELNYYFMLLAHQGVMQAVLPDITTYGDISPDVNPGEAENIITTETNKITYTKRIPVCIVRDDSGKEIQGDDNESTPIFELVTRLEVFRDGKNQIQHQYQYSIEVYSSNFKDKFAIIFSPLYGFLSTLLNSQNFDNEEVESALFRFNTEYKKIEGDLVSHFVGMLPEHEKWLSVSVVSNLKDLIKKLEENGRDEYLECLNALLLALRKKYNLIDSASRLFRQSCSRILDPQTIAERIEEMRKVEETINQLQYSQEEGAVIERSQIVNSISSSIEIVGKINKKKLKEISEILAMEDGMKIIQDACRDRLQDFIKNFFTTFVREKSDPSCEAAAVTLLEEIKKFDDEKIKNDLLLELANIALSGDVYEFLTVKLVAPCNRKVKTALEGLKDSINIVFREESQKVNELIKICEKYEILLEKIIRQGMQKEIKFSFDEENDFELSFFIHELVDESSELFDVASDDLINLAKKYDLIVNILQKGILQNPQLNNEEKLKQFYSSLSANQKNLEMEYLPHFVKIRDDLISKTEELEREAPLSRATGKPANFSASLKSNKHDIEEINQILASSEDLIGKKFLENVNNVGKIISDLDHICENYKADLLRIISDELRNQSFSSSDFNMEKILFALFYYDEKLHEKSSQENMNEILEFRRWAKGNTRLQAAVYKYDIVANKLQKDCLRNAELSSFEDKIVDFEKAFRENNKCLGVSIRRNRWSFWQSSDFDFVQEVDQILQNDSLHRVKFVSSNRSPG